MNSKEFTLECAKEMVRFGVDEIKIGVLVAIERVARKEFKEE